MAEPDVKHRGIEIIDRSAKFGKAGEAQLLAVAKIRRGFQRAISAGVVEVSEIACGFGSEVLDQVTASGISPMTKDKTACHWLDVNFAHFTAAAGDPVCERLGEIAH